MATLSEALTAALDHHAAGRLAEAETLYGRILHASPGLPDAEHLLGVLLAQTGRAAEGLRRVETAIAGNPGAAPYHLNRGKLLEAVGRGAEAPDAYRAALVRQPGLAEALTLLEANLRRAADAAFDRGDYPAADAGYCRLLALRPADLGLAFDYGITLKRLGRLHPAARWLRWAAAAHPAAEPAVAERLAAERAEIFYGLGDFVRAAAAFSTALHYRPDHAPYHWARALAYQQGGCEAASVAAAYRRYLALRPDDGAGWSNFCLAARVGGDIPLAVAAGLRAVCLGAEDAAALVNLGAAQVAAEDWRGAARSAALAVVLDPASAAGLLNRATALSALQQMAAAERVLRWGGRVAAETPGLLAQRGFLLEAQGQATAIPVLQRALALQPTDGESWAAASRAALRSGDVHTAHRWAQWAGRLSLSRPSALLAAAVALEALGDVAAALALYDRVIALTPGIGTAFTRRALLLASAVAPVPTPRAPSFRPRLGASQIGHAGRFGNQLLQYAFLRVYAERCGLELETPLWIGRGLYGFDEPLPQGPLPPLHEDAVDFVAGTGDAAGHDIQGYFCGDMAPLAPYRETVRGFFRPVAGVADHGNAVSDALRRRGRTLVALHLRRGDFGGTRFWIAPEEWYRDWLSSLWPGLERPVLYIASDDPAMAGKFTDFNPVTAVDVAAPLPGIGFFTDHWVLSQADILATSNSSFSFTAALLNTRAALMVRPDRAVRRLVPFDPWSSRVLLD